MPEQIACSAGITFNLSQNKKAGKSIIDFPAFFVLFANKI
ncbi:MAG: hypothetical protein AVDCRST_MAG74-3596 [uncultured Pyrinomonadaceae bacterium]|uniref:Uncharacterized protein n=1 Tax=uncultured Pyrinomonadaceae bacterium TaxID=2283094 RepID=A0A6J4Q1N0_9BACT|nr:MAG: hypothetical protein AVDCRST_MAG74-3596 [uncultured Pyrinomonadaceae bacterium]